MHIKSLFLLLLCLVVSGKAQAQYSLQFSSCVSEGGALNTECNVKATNVFESRFYKMAFREKLVVNDSVYVRFKISESNELKILNAFTRYSSDLLKLAFNFISSSKGSLQPLPDTATYYEWGYAIALENEWLDYKALDNRVIVPKLHMPGENDNAENPFENYQRTMYELLLIEVDKALQKVGVNDQFLAKAYFKKGRPVGLQIFLGSYNPKNNDLITTTILRSFTVLQDSVESENYDDFSLPISFGLSNTPAAVSEYRASFFEYCNLIGAERQIRGMLLTESLGISDSVKMVNYLDSIFKVYPTISMGSINIYGWQTNLKEIRNVRMARKIAKSKLGGDVLFGGAKEIHNYSVVDLPPVWEGCETYTDNAEDLKRCFEGTVKNYIWVGMPDFGLESTKVVHYFSFVVELDSSISNVELVRAGDEKILKAARELLAKAPKVVPAKMNGRPVRMSFIAPVRLTSYEALKEGYKHLKSVYKSWDENTQQEFIAERIDIINRRREHYSNDSIYFLYKMDKGGHFRIFESFYLNSKDLMDECEQELRNVAQYISKEDKGRKKEISFVFTLPEKFEKFNNIFEVERPIVVNECTDFNLKGQQACGNYLSKIAEGKLAAGKLKSDIKARVYFEKGNVAAIHFTEPTQDKSQNDSIYSIFNRLAAKYIDNGKSGRSDDQWIEFTVPVKLDSTERYGYEVEQLQYLKTLSNKEAYLTSLMSHSKDYYKDEKRVAFIKRGLETIVSDSAESFYANGTKYQMDSIVGYPEKYRKHLAEIESEKSSPGFEVLPVFAGCNEFSADKKELSGCFQKQFLNHVVENFTFTETARQNGIQGKVYTSFIIEKDGTVQGIKIVRGVHQSLDLECIRIISELPDMHSPAMQRGKPVRMSFTMPINAKLQ